MLQSHIKSNGGWPLNKLNFNVQLILDAVHSVPKFSGCTASASMPENPRWLHCYRVTYRTQDRPQLLYTAQSL